MIDWQILTGEYPPQSGGVSDYTRLVARGLVSAGDSVVVWAPPVNGNGAGSTVNSQRDDAITVRRLPDRFGPRSLRMLSAELNQIRTPHRLLVQYVPHAFGWKAANLPFCLWLASRRRDSVWVMFHEVAYPFDAGAGLRRNVLAVLNRMMAATVARVAERAFISIPAWQSGVDAVTPAATPVTWLPVPSSIPVVSDQQRIAAIRTELAHGQAVVGHFGTYGALIKPLLDESILLILKKSDCRVFLLGHGSEAARESMIERDQDAAHRVVASGTLPAETLSTYISACDVMLQPYPDGISTRRTSAMVALAHGVPLVTTKGALTEAIWAEREAAVMVPAGTAEALGDAVVALLRDPARRAAVARRGGVVYDEHFDVRHTIAALRSSA
jgi:glycosyltransferase involved in cell wall biosynthesis